MIRSCKKPPVYFPSVTGSICSFNSQYADLPLKSCVSQISGYQEGSGTPSPSNVRQLHAWSGANLTACGANLWNEEYQLGFWGADGVFRPNTSGYMSSKNAIHIKPNMECCITIPNSFNKTIYLAFYDENGVFIERVTRSLIGTGYYKFSHAKAYAVNFSTEAFYGTTYKNDISINYPSTDTSYHAYNGNTYTFTFGQSIYQGYIDWKRGVVVGTHGIADLGSLNWNKYGTDKFYTTISDIKLPTTIAERNQGIWCSIYKPSTGYSLGDMSDKSFLKFNQDENFWIYDSDYTDATAFKTAMNGVMLAYELATPIEIPLGGVNLLTQEGQNNIYCDTGDTTLEYIKAGR